MKIEVAHEAEPRKLIGWRLTAGNDTLLVYANEGGFHAGTEFLTNDRGVTYQIILGDITQIELLRNEIRTLQGELASCKLILGAME